MGSSNQLRMKKYWYWKVKWREKKKPPSCCSSYRVNQSMPLWHGMASSLKCSVVPVPSNLWYPQIKNSLTHLFNSFDTWPAI